MHNCLIVDESSVIRKVAARIIFQLGFEVEGVASFDEALASIAKNGLPSLLIAAAGAAEGDAAGFVRLCRARPEGRDALILALLVDSNLGLMTRLKRAGTNGFLFKPFTREELSRSLSPHTSRLMATAA